MSHKRDKNGKHDILYAGAWSKSSSVTCLQNTRTNTHLIVQCHVDIHVISWSGKKRTAVQRQLLQTSRCLCRDAKLDIYYIPLFSLLF